VQKNLFQKSNLKLSDEKSRPKHVAIILHDRNRVNRTYLEMSEDNGVENSENHLKQIVETAIETGICRLTLICPNAGDLTEPKVKSSTSDLFAYLFGGDSQWLVDRGIFLSYLGNRNDLSPETLLLLKHLDNRAPEHQNLRLAISGGNDGRKAITHAARKIAVLVKSGEIIPDDISPELIDKHIDLTNLAAPDPDLVVITGGVKRLENSFLWQSAYSEFVFSDAPWSDFSSAHFYAALLEFTSRERRFGGLVATK